MCVLYILPRTKRNHREREKMRDVTQSKAIHHSSLLKGAILRLTLLGLALVCVFVSVRVCECVCVCGWVGVHKRERDHMNRRP